MRLALGSRRRRRSPEQRRVVAEEDRDPIEPRSDPDELARGAELVELLGPIFGHAPRQQLRLPERDGQRERLQRNERFAERRTTVDPVPAREEAAERCLLHRLDLAAKRGERRAPQAAQDLGIAPLPLGAAGPELAADELLVALELAQLLLDVEAEPGRRLGGRERPTPARPARDERTERVGNRLEERVGEARGRDDAERVAIAARILRRRESLLAGDAHADRAPFRLEDRGVRLVELARAQVAAQSQQVVEPLGIVRERPQRRLDLGERGRVDELAQLLLAEQLPQEVAIERQRLRTPLRRRRVVLVHVGRDVVEEKRGREGRRRRRLDVDEVDLARAEPAEQPLQRRQVEHVLQALAVRLEDDREARVLARDLEQPLRLEPLLPERRPLAGPAARDEERAGGVLAEPRAEERRLPHLGEHEILELVGVEHEQVGRRRRVGVGQVERDAVVRPDRLHLEAERLAQPRADSHRPRRVDARTERREDADAPVADLVAEALDDDRAVGRERAGRLLLLAQEGEEVRARRARRDRRHLRVARREQLARELADRLAELVRAADALALPERHGSRDARRRRHEHAVARDLLDPPRRGAEHDHLARARLVDHLLVELADAAAAVRR